MNKLIVLALTTLIATSMAFAQAPAAAAAKAAPAAVAKPATEAAKPAAAAPAAPAAPVAKAAAGDCEAKAVGKNGKPLAGAAKAASIKKCQKNAKAK